MIPSVLGACFPLTDLQVFWAPDDPSSVTEGTGAAMATRARAKAPAAQRETPLEQQQRQEQTREQQRANVIYE